MEGSLIGVNFYILEGGRMTLCTDLLLGMVNRQKLAQLFQDYLMSGEEWGESEAGCVGNKICTAAGALPYILCVHTGLGPCPAGGHELLL